MSNFNLNELRSKDELVTKLKNIINVLSKFIKMAEKMIEVGKKNFNLNEFSNLLNTIKEIPDELKHSPLLIEETIKFVEGIIGEVHSIRLQIEKSFSSKNGTLKKAVETLDKIPESTMKATQEILNTLDNIMAKEGDIFDILNELKESGTQDKEKLEKLETLLLENQNDHFDIMNALQFQDITTQQIEHVNDLLEKTEIKLSKLALKLRGLDEADIKKIIEEQEKNRTRVYDPNAEYKQKEEEQHFADTLYEEQKNKETLDQDDIENLLSQFGK